MDEAAFLHALTLAVFAAGSLSCLVLLGVRSAPYGRYSDARWGPQVPARLGWVVQESPTLVASAACVWLEWERMSARPTNLALLALFVLHYSNRTLVYPFQLRNPKPMPLSIPLMAWLFCAVNGYLQARSLTKFLEFDAGHLMHPRTLLGAALFFAGMHANVHCDAILRNLRKPGETGYKIPRGGLFEYVSGANFAAEILEWTGFAIAVGSPQAWAFAFFTAANIGPRARTHHQWYKEKFGEEYPEERKALIPFVW